MAAIADLIAGLQTALQGRDTQAVLRRHLSLVADILKLLAQQADTRLDTLEATVSTLQAVPVVTVTVVADLASLPATSPPTRFYRVQGDPNLYIGNGPGNPLGRMVPA
jgi:hypothetical protein